MFTFKDWIANWRGRYGYSSPSTKVLRTQTPTSILFIFGLSINQFNIYKIGYQEQMSL